MKKTNWERKPIVDLCSEHVDCVNRTAPVVDGPTPYKMIRTTNVRNGFIDTENVRFVTEEVYRRWTRRLVPKRGDVILTREAPLGDVGKVRTDDTIFLGQRLYHFRPDPALLDADFLLYALMSSDLQGQVRGFGSGATVEHMRLADIPNLKINAPSVAVQRKIAGVLAAYDELIANNTRRMKLLEQMAQALYREWFVRPCHSGNLPKGWECRNVKDVATVTYGFPFQSKMFNATGAGTPVIRIRDILDGVSQTFTEEDAEPKYHVKNGHILVGMDGDFHMCIWASGHAFQNQRVARFESNGDIGNFHLFLALEKPIQAFNQSIVGTTVAHLGDMHIKTIPIVWPPANLRARGREFLEPMSEQIIVLKRQTANLRRTRDLLLPKLISGEVDVSELEMRKT